MGLWINGAPDRLLVLRIRLELGGCACNMPPITGTCTVGNSPIRDEQPDFDECGSLV